MYWDSLRELSKMHEEMDRMFNKAFYGTDIPLLGHGKTEVGLPNTKIQNRAPICHLQETETKLVGTFELPGVNKADINLIVDDDHLELSVESRFENKKENDNKYSFMSQRSSFQRYMRLPKEIISQKANAEYKDGILRVEMPKKHKDDKGGKKLQIK